VSEPSPLELRAFRGEDGASLAALRIGFGLTMLTSVLRFFAYGRIDEYFVAPEFHFTYLGFGWVRPFGPTGMNLLFALLGVLTVLVTVGFHQRLSSFLFFLGFGYVFLLEKARYLNHYYLVLIFALLLSVLPASRVWSIDARRKDWTPVVPAWSLFLVRTQIGIVYFLAGVAKLNGDWLRARPLDEWLPRRAGHPWLGWLLSSDYAPWLFSYAGLLLDLLAWPLLLWRRTRLATFVALLAFHLMNSAVFSIGIFPWLMIAVTTIFFAPDWPRRLLAAAPGPGPGPDDASLAAPEVPGARRRRLILNGIFVYLLFQLAVPLRHFLYPGNVSWTEEGHMFAWHMKLRGKEADARFYVLVPGEQAEVLVDPRQEGLTSWQYDKMSGRPDMLHQFAQHLAREYALPGQDLPRVRVVALCSLNGREPRPLIRPTVDLARVPRNLLPADWILPLDD